MNNQLNIEIIKNVTVEIDEYIDVYEGKSFTRVSNSVYFKDNYVGELCFLDDCDTLVEAKKALDNFKKELLQYDCVDKQLLLIEIELGLIASPDFVDHTGYYLNSLVSIKANEVQACKLAYSYFSEKEKEDYFLKSHIRHKKK